MGNKVNLSSNAAMPFAATILCDNRPVRIRYSRRCPSIAKGKGGMGPQLDISHGQEYPEQIPNTRWATTR